MTMRMYVVQTADSGNLAAPRDAARSGRAAAMSRRRALAAGRSALAPAQERVRTGFREAELRTPAATADATYPAPADGQCGPGSAVATDARRGRALSMQRRRQLAKGKLALNGGGGRTAAAGAGTPALTLHRGGGG